MWCVVRGGHVACSNMCVMGGIHGEGSHAARKFNQIKVWGGRQASEEYFVCSGAAPFRKGRVASTLRSLVFLIQEAWMSETYHNLLDYSEFVDGRKFKTPHLINERPLENPTQSLALRIKSPPKS